MSMNRRICSYDKVEVSRDCYTITEEQGDIYLCNPRCLCLWAMQRATRPHIVEADQGCALIMTLPASEKRRFEGIVELAQWAAAKAIGTAESEWLRKGQELG
jgi:hypothetical protein